MIHLLDTWKGVKVEIWKDIKGFEGSYQVSSEGRVKSLRRRTPVHSGKGARWIPERELKPIIQNNGYLRVSLYDQESKPHAGFIHRMVAEAFLPNPGSLPVVRHLDDQKRNNRVENLAWGTYQDNTDDMFRNGGNHQASKTHCPQGHPYSGENLMMTVSSTGRLQRRCAACRKETARASKKARKDKVPPKHGTEYIYRDYKCRCRPCTEAHQEFLQADRVRKAEKRHSVKRDRLTEKEE